MYVGKKLKQLRNELELNQEGFAKALGVSQSYYSSVEMGKKPISDKLLAVIEQKWGVKIDWFTKEYPSLHVYQSTERLDRYTRLLGDEEMGVNYGGDVGGKNRTIDIFDKPAYLRSLIVIEKKLRKHLNKNPDIQKIDIATLELFSFEETLRHFNLEYLSFIYKLPAKTNLPFEDIIEQYYKSLEGLMPYKNAIIQLSEAIIRFNKEMSKAGDPYFKLIEED